jgi:uncharacterized protein
MESLDRSLRHYSLSEADFGNRLATVLSSSHPLQSQENLFGRSQQLTNIRKALFQHGRHILIHGLRGVGKSSLAQTAAFQLSEGIDPIIIGCEPTSTFVSTMREILAEACGRDPKFKSKIVETSAGFSKFGISLGTKITVQSGENREPVSINDCVRLFEFYAKEVSGRPIIVIDEFDQIGDITEQAQFANFVKQVSDRHIPVRFIFCGIGESVQALLAGHASLDRYFHTESLGQLPWEARFEIVQNAADKLDITVDNTTEIRIARVSDGFPYYVHFLTEKLFWKVWEAQNSGIVTHQLFEAAMNDSANSMDMRLRGPYQLATEKYTKDSEFVLWAAADGHELRKRSTDIFESYLRIVDTLKQPRVDRPKFNQRMARLKEVKNGAILSGTRAGWYEFSEKMIRGYVRLRAEQNGVLLEADHPSAPRRISK